MASSILKTLLTEMCGCDATDLYLCADSAPMLRIGDNLRVSSSHSGIFKQEEITELFAGVLQPSQNDEFKKTRELNCSLHYKDIGRFRINLFVQQRKIGAVIRRIRSEIPTFDALNLPPDMQKLAMLSRGLIVIAGQAGSGKSTTAASLIEYRNQHGRGHIITVEDPVEFVYTPAKCLISQREVGIDTASYGAALKNALRQRPDVVYIGEVRDYECMDHALHFAETGHLCIITIHAADAAQTLERIASFFPIHYRSNILLVLSQVLKAVVCQRLITTKSGEKVLATEFLHNQGYINQLILEGKYKEIKSIIERSGDQGMHTFDQSLLSLFKSGQIDRNEALNQADSYNNMEVSFNLNARQA